MKKLFIDELISSPKINGGDEETRNSLKESRVFLVQNILPTVPDKINYSHLPRLTPPYDDCWFEWTTNVKKREDAPDDFPDEFDEKMIDIMMNMEGDARNGVKVTSNRSDEKGWSLYFQFFSRIGNNNTPLMFPLAYVVKLSNEGLFESIKEYIQDDIHPIFKSLATNALQDNMFQMHIDTVLYALGLLNCKNIVTIERGGKPNNLKRNRHQKWMHRHYILQIRPLREVTKMEYEGEITEETMKEDLSFHFCRGHFKTYTPEKPLLGKYIGTFWWDAHARGSIKKGIVTKDYNINSPKDELLT